MDMNDDLYRSHMSSNRYRQRDQTSPLDRHNSNNNHRSNVQHHSVRHTQHPYQSEQHFHRESQSIHNPYQRSPVTSRRSPTQDQSSALVPQQLMRYSHEDQHRNAETRSHHTHRPQLELSHADLIKQNKKKLAEAFLAHAPSLGMVNGASNRTSPALSNLAGRNKRRYEGDPYDSASSTTRRRDDAPYESRLKERDEPRLTSSPGHIELKKPKLELKSNHPLGSVAESHRDYSASTRNDALRETATSHQRSSDPGRGAPEGSALVMAVNERFETKREKSPPGERSFVNAIDTVRQAVSSSEAPLDLCTSPKSSNSSPPSPRPTHSPLRGSPAVHASMTPILRSPVQETDEAHHATPLEAKEDLKRKSPELLPAPEQQEGEPKPNTDNANPAHKRLTGKKSIDRKPSPIDLSKSTRTDADDEGISSAMFAQFAGLRGSSLLSYDGRSINTPDAVSRKTPSDTTAAFFPSAVMTPSPMVRNQSKYLLNRLTLVALTDCLFSIKL